jgi:hypothetical protein
MLADRIILIQKNGVKEIKTNDIEKSIKNIFLNNI